MKCLLFCCLCFVCGALPALGQRSFGIKGGLNVSQQTGDRYKTFTGYQAGAFYRTPLGAGLALSGEVNFSLIGSRKGYITEAMIQQQDFTARYYNQKFGYIEIPLFLQYQLGPVYAGAGPAVSYLLFSRIAHFENTTGTMKGLKPFDLSANGVAGCRLSRRVSIDIRYSRGLMNTEQGTLFTRKNRFVNLSLLYALKTGRK